MNTPGILCLTFMQMLGNSHSHIPQHVDGLLKSKMRMAFHAQYPQATLDFNNEACPNRGQYWYNSNGLVLEAEHTLWSGRLENSISDLLDGQKIAYAQTARGALTEHEPASALETVLASSLAEKKMEEKESNHKKNMKWLWWSLGLAGLATGTVLGIKHFSHSKSPGAAVPIVQPNVPPKSSLSQGHSL